MPLCGRYACGSAEIAVWKIEETIEQLSSLVDSATFVESEKFASVERRSEWLAVRALLRLLLGGDARVVYDEAGKPSLEGGRVFMSVSHTRGYAAVALSQDFPLGLDVELADREVGIASRRFMREEELDGVAPHLHNDAKLIRWTVSEALFKLVGDLGGNFRENIVIDGLCPERYGLFALSVDGVSRGNGRYWAAYLFDAPLLVTVCGIERLAALRAV